MNLLMVFYLFQTRCNIIRRHELGYLCSGEIFLSDEFKKLHTDLYFQNIHVKVKKFTYGDLVPFEKAKKETRLNIEGQNLKKKHNGSKFDYYILDDSFSLDNNSIILKQEYVFKSEDSPLYLLDYKLLNVKLDNENLYKKENELCMLSMIYYNLKELERIINCYHRQKMWYDFNTAIFSLKEDRIDFITTLTAKIINDIFKKKDLVIITKEIYVQLMSAQNFYASKGLLEDFSNFYQNLQQLEIRYLKFLNIDSNFFEKRLIPSRNGSFTTQMIFEKSLILITSERNKSQQVSLELADEGKNTIEKVLNFKIIDRAIIIPLKNLIKEKIYFLKISSEKNKDKNGDVEVELINLRTLLKGKPVKN
ncbi:hypothetical protein NGRA_0902 [Nosema granulosis]|uniref:Uncharacterized protein n=1 Tax=Nosema granulosis TaxID=83296 RepID=A0A9P6H0H6_9MICR|nr:hypothetical protein NGRA_0902 [Nosema granulosis]